MANSIGKPAEKPSVQPPGSAVKPAEAITKPGEIAPAGGDTIAPHTAKLQESGGLTAPLKPGDNAQEVAQKTANQQLEAQGLKGVVRTDSSNPINAPLKPEQTANVRVQTDTSKPGMTQGQIDAANKAAAARAPESAVKPGDTATKPGMTQGQIDAANKAAAARAPETAVKPGSSAERPAGIA